MEHLYELTFGEIQRIVVEVIYSEENYINPTPIDEAIQKSLDDIAIEKQRKG